MVLWYCGTVVLWDCGTVVLWDCGTVVWDCLKSSTTVPLEFTCISIQVVLWYCGTLQKTHPKTFYNLEVIGGLGTSCKMGCCIPI